MKLKLRMLWCSSILSVLGMLRQETSGLRMTWLTNELEVCLGYTVFEYYSQYSNDIQRKVIVFPMNKAKIVQYNFDFGPVKS